MDDLTGRRLGAYRIVAPLGEGGMATVYRARQEGKIERDVALKVLARHFSTSREFMARFSQEASILAGLRHPHILPIFDFGEQDGYTYLVMPFIESGTLADLMTGKPLPLPQIRQIIPQVADALDYAHGRGIIHRDVKPSNVLVDERGNCYLGDFGISKIVEDSSRLTSTGIMLGTPEYMSPEQGRGEALDGRSDIYSLGVVLYEMAAGRVPYRANTPLAVIYRHIQDALPPARLLNPDIPEALEAVLAQALAKSPAERFATAGQFGQAVRQAIPERGRGWEKTMVVPAVEAPPPMLPTPMAGDTATLPIALDAGVMGAASSTPVAGRRWGRWAGLVGLAALAVIGLLAAGLGRPKQAIQITAAPVASGSNATALAPTVAPYDDFSNPAFNGSFNPALWRETKTRPVRFRQQDGALVIDSTSFTENGNNKLEPLLPGAWEYTRFKYMQVRLKMGRTLPVVSGGMIKAQVVYPLPASSYGWAECQIAHTDKEDLQYFCEVRTLLNGSTTTALEYTTGNVAAAWDTWYTSRIELDQFSGEFRFYLDRRLIGRHIPKDVDFLKTASLYPQIGSWTDGNEWFVGYFDDVIFGH